MKQLRNLVILIAFFAGIAFVFADETTHTTMIPTDEQAYRTGYSEGFHHGVADKAEGLDFNFRHDHKFQTGISWDSETNANFRAGYKEGYEDGYNRTQAGVQQPLPQEFSSGLVAFRIGYKEGYNHGAIDREAGLDFNYQHDHKFQSGISYDRYTNASFRAGYKEGYEDAFQGESPKLTKPVEPAVEPHEPAVEPQAEGVAMIFTEEGFDGKSQDYNVGKYPEIDPEKIESIQLKGNVRVVLYERPNFQGQTLIIEKDTANLKDLNFEDRAHSMVIEPRQ